MGNVEVLDPGRLAGALKLLTETPTLTGDGSVERKSHPSVGNALKKIVTGLHNRVRTVRLSVSAFTLRKFCLRSKFFKGVITTTYT